MSTRAAGHLLPALALAAALAACGGERDATARAEEAPGAAPVYTSEVESVSRWIRQGGGSADSAGLMATANPHGEGVIVYSGGDSASGGERAAWVVVDSQVVPLNRASRRATPGLPAREDERTRQRIGIQRTNGEAELRGVLPPPEAPPARPPARQREAEPPVVKVPEPSDAIPLPVPPRATGPRDTLRIPEDTAPPARRDPSRDASAREPADTLRIPSPSEPARDTLHIPGPAAEPAAPEPETAPALPSAFALPTG